MNPALSIITFTTLAGAAQGLAVVLALSQLFGAGLDNAFVARSLWVAVALAIGLMFALRCLHPPGGASALLMVLAGVTLAGGASQGWPWQVVHSATRWRS